MTSVADFAHRFVPASAPGRAPLLLLHGTGGDENDLLPLGRELAPGRALLSPRGQVLEGPHPRFFRRLAEGVFDVEDVRRRTADLAAWVTEAGRHYGLEKPVALGFSNGANIAAAMLLLHPDVLGGAVLLRALAPVEPGSLSGLDGKPVLVATGSSDPINPIANGERLSQLLQAAGADVTHEVVPGSHGLTPRDVEIARNFLNRH
ncbi:alpha/beta hydrolase [uncultured Alsobacter sp.]|uniref:alpha/beta hydrolase n=1 Tax=uncultured Alsobacter sp. TaxID=1748258 RepID=UPI0025FF20A6|nr:alpha/beta hydrolase [uncultured Alsobacter sp.]